MKIFLFLLGIFTAITLGVFTWKKYDGYFDYQTQTLHQFITKLVLVFGVVLLSMYGIFLFI